MKRIFIVLLIILLFLTSCTSSTQTDSSKNKDIDVNQSKEEARENEDNTNGQIEKTEKTEETEETEEDESKALLVKNKYANYTIIDQEAIEYEDGLIVSPIIPYSDFYSFFTKLPLGHTVATGKGINVGVIGDKLKADFIYFTAREAKVFFFNELSVDSLKEQNINIVAISSFKSLDNEEIKSFCQDCIKSNISVVLQGDIAVSDDEIQLVNELEEEGVITVGQVQRQGTTFRYTNEGIQPFNSRLKDLSINVFNCSFDKIEQENYDYRYSLYGVTGALAMVLEKQELAPLELKEHILNHSREVWELLGADGSNMDYEDDVTRDNTTAYLVPVENSDVYKYKQLDLEYLLDIKLKAPWNSNIFNTAKAWEITKGNIDVAVIDEGFFPDSIIIKDSVVEKKKFGNSNWNELTNHGGLMCIGVLSIAPEAKLHLLLADTSSENGQYDGCEYITEALDYCIQKNIPIVSMSFASVHARDQKLVEKVQEAKDAGIVVIWFHYPKEVKGILKPAFTYGGKDQIATFDRFVSQNNMSGPQEGMAGLSSSSPQVAGLVALIKSQNPLLTPEDIADLLKNNSTIIPKSEGLYIPDIYKILKEMK